MSPDIGLMVKDYEDWKAKKKAIGTLDNLARKHGLSKSLFLYHVNKKGQTTANGCPSNTRLQSEVNGSLPQ